MFKLRRVILQKTYVIFFLSICYRYHDKNFWYIPQSITNKRKLIDFLYNGFTNQRMNSRNFIKIILKIIKDENYKFHFEAMLIFL